MKKRLSIFQIVPILLFWGLVFCLPDLAHAACTSPTGVAGEVVYNQDSHIHQYCNNSSWIAMAGGIGNGGSGATPTTSGLIGYWKLDDGSGTTAIDSAGSNNGTLTNGPTWTTGQMSGAVSFDGVDDYIVTNDLGNMLDGISAFTFSAWVKVTGPCSSGMCSVGGKYNSAQEHLRMTFDNAYNIVLYLSFSEKGLDSSVVQLNVWEHWVMVYDGTLSGNANRLKFYRDGNQRTLSFSGTIPSVTYSNNQPFIIGGDPYTGLPAGKLFPGFIDDVRIYNRALSATEIQQLYSYGRLGGGAGCLAPAGVEGSINFNTDTRKLQYCDGDEWRAMGTCGEDPESTKVAHWKLDESSGTSAADATTNSLTGTLTNGPVWQSTGGQISGALSFDGSNDYVAVTDPGASSVLDFTTGDSITMTAWIKPTSVTTSYQVILSKGVTLGVNNGNYDFYILNNSGEYRIAGGFEDSGATYHGIYAPSMPLVAGTWQFVTLSLTFGGANSGKITYNGASYPVSTTNSPYSAVPMVTNEPLWIGAYNEAGGAAVDIPFGGSIDDVRIYRRILSDTDIKALYDQGKYRNFDNGKVAHWPLDESAGTTVADLVGVSPGTAVNSPTWVPTGGQIGGAMDFDGADDRVDVGSDASLDALSALTIVAWIKPDTLGEGPSLGRIIGKTSTNTTTGGWTFNLDTTNRLTFDVDYATTDFRRRAANNSITLGQWQQVAVTWTGSATATNAKLYVNGVETSYATTTNGTGGRVNDAAQSISIGNPPGLTDRSFDGKIDNVRIYNRVLTATEIAALYDAAISGNACTTAGEMLYDSTLNAMKYCDGSRWRGFGDCTGDAPGMAAQWKFDETSGTSAADSSGNSLTGTLYNGPVWSSGSLTFDGTDDYILASDPGTGSVLDFTTGDSITVTAWLNPAAFSTWQAILVKNDSVGSANANYELGVYNTGLISFYFTQPAGTWHGFDSPTGLVGTGSWQFVAFTGTFGMMQNARFYYNGLPYSATVGNGTPYTTAPLVANDPLIFGGENEGSLCCSYNGSLDDVRIYRRILSSEEIQNLYLKGR